MSFLQALFGSPDIGKMETKGDIDGLLKALGYEKDPSVRRAAALALGRIGGLRAIEPLVAALNDNEMGVRQVAAEALGKIGKPAVETLIDKIARDYQRKFAINAVLMIGSPAVEPLIAALKDVSKATRQAAAETLGRIGDARAVEPLIDALKDMYKDVGRAAAEALGKISDARAIEPLIVALRDNSVREAAEALDRLGWNPGEDELGASYWIAKKRLDKCIEIGKPAVEPLIAAFGENSDMRKGVAETLIVIGDARALGPLTDALKDKDIHQAVTETLGAIGDARAGEPLIAALREADRTATVDGLHAELLECLGGSRSNYKLLGIIYALVKLGDPRSAEPIRDAYNACVYMPQKEEQFAEALWKLPGLPAFKALVSCMYHAQGLTSFEFAANQAIPFGEAIIARAGEAGAASDDTVLPELRRMLATEIHNGWAGKDEQTREIARKALLAYEAAADPVHPPPEQEQLSPDL